MPASRLRRVLLPLVAILVIVLVAAAVLGVGLVRRSFPQTAGDLEVAGLTAPVTVVRDELGVAHLYADTPEDLFLAQGYVAAQDRFFQMDLRRHVTAGRLSELVGEAGVETDTVIRTMGWRRVAEAELPTLSPEARRYLQSYAAGVNAYLAERPSPSQVGLEYVLLAQTAPGYSIEPWDEVDSLAWLKAMAWDLRGNYTDELARARLAGDVSLNQLTSLYPDYPFDQHDPILSDDEWKADLSQGGTAVTDPADEPTDDATTGDRGGAVTPGPDPVRPKNPVDLASLERTESALAAIPPLLSGDDGVGSNSWVVSGEHTESGLPLLANDPHLGVTQPGIWMQAGLHCREVSQACPFDVSGFTFAGFPGVVIGHNQNIAWGFTNLDPDVTDFYWEDIEDGQYRRENTWVPLETRAETIRVAGGEDVEIEVRATDHGPILSDAIDGVRDAGQSAPVNGVESSQRYDVSMAWTGLEKSRTAEAVFALNSATDWEEFRAAAKLFAVPSQNLVYADTEGNIGYQAPGLIPVRQSSTTGKPPGYWPSPGWDPAYDWKGWVPFSQLPFVLNPDDGIIVTANQAVSRFNTPFLTTEWDTGYRSQRILDLLHAAAAEGPLTTDTMTTIQTDTYSEFADALVPALLEVDLDDAFYTEAQDLLRDWDRTAPASGEQSAAATYFYAVWAQVLEQTFNDELPSDLHATGNARWMTLTENLLSKPEDPWWDDKRTVGVVETRDEVLRNAMVEARLDLTRRLSKNPEDWEWGRLHRVSMSHEVFSAEGVPEIVQGIFSDGPYGMPGGSALVNANSWDAGSGTYQVTAAPSMRMVVDLADLDASRWVNQTGNSGHPFHRNYNDQTQAWIEGETYPWVHSPEAVEEAGEQTLTLLPPGSDN
ncbi:penicillin acylase family protein [Ornithinicoccus hortensis]|uniref:Penicillin amidase n=1 Tax=Ornithinicoccus hortensis TaxID=82346 RepID=A0A542YVP4_9MICO|nr:penicillin acylase family protein [Ornithinicoccus hortensis]TQL52147.1 penicillin amidase [Ornithinicoccus hortensis]